MMKAGRDKAEAAAQGIAQDKVARRGQALRANLKKRRIQGHNRRTVNSATAAPQNKPEAPKQP